MFRALSIRDHAPPCERVEALTTQVVADLTWLADHATQPPWVGMRAAHCLVAGHGVEAADALLRWVTDPETRGLGLLVLDGLARLPEDLAVRIATRAIAEGRDPDAARQRVLQDPREAVKATAG